MVYIRWDDRYRIGHEVVDRQHRRLFQLINDLEQKAASGGGREAAIEAINSLVDYAVVHFADEEELMEQIGFDRLIQHRWQHRSFVGKIADLALEWGQGRETSVDDLLLFLKDWLLNHVLAEDMPIGVVLQARQKTSV